MAAGSAKKKKWLCGCSFRFALLVLSVYLNQLKLFQLYLSLFADYSEKAVTINYHIQRANAQSFVFVTSNHAEVTIGSDWNLRRSATLFWRPWCYSLTNIFQEKILQSDVHDSKDHKMITSNTWIPKNNFHSTNRYVTLPVYFWGATFVAYQLF